MILTVRYLRMGLNWINTNRSKKLTLKIMLKLDYMIYLPVGGDWKL